MPNTESAKKSFRQSVSRRSRNLAGMKDLKTAIKGYKKAPSSEGLTSVYRKLDKAAKTNLIKKNKAARLKGRLSRLVTTKK